MEYKQFSFKKVYTLLSFYFTKYNNLKKSGNLSDFEREIDSKIGNPITRDVLYYLIDQEILIFDKKILGIKYYYLNQKQIYNLIEEQKILKLHNKYLKHNSVIFR